MTLQVAESTLSNFPSEYVQHLCRLCLCSREETARQRLNRVEWFKWPGAEITRLYEQVVGEQLLVSEHLSELHCDACHAWLEGTCRRIAEFKRIASMWTDHLLAHGHRQLPLHDNDDAAAAAVVAEVASIVGCVEEVVETSEVPEQKLCKTEPPDAVADEVQIEVEILKPAELPDELQSEPAIEEYVLEEFIEKAAPEMGDDRLEDEYEDTNEYHLIYDEDDELDYAELEDSNAVPNPFPTGLYPSSDQSPSQAPTSTLICDMCAEPFADKPSLLRHFTTTHGLVAEAAASAASATSATSSLHPCPHCRRTYRHERFLADHLRHHHTEAGATPECRYCRCPLTGDRAKHAEPLSAQRLRQQHYEQCPVLRERRGQRVQPSSRQPLRCPQCPASYLRPATLRKHYEKDHWITGSAEGAVDAVEPWPAVEARICVRCFRQFGDAAAAEEHRRAVHERWKCEVCQKLCTCAQSLERHRQKHSGKERRFQCAECAGTYVTAHQLKIHHRRKHTAERPFACEEEGCGKRYAERSELNVHWRSAHSAQKFACDRCEGVFNSAKYLQQHVATDHTGEYRYFVCKRCERKFVNTRLLNIHMAVHHAGEVAEEGGEEVAAEEAAAGSGSAGEGALEEWGEEVEEMEVEEMAV